MKSKLIHEHHGEKTFALIFDTGDEAMAGLVEFAKAEPARRQPVHRHRRVPRRDAGLLRLGDRRSTRRSPCASRSRSSR